MAGALKAALGSQAEMVVNKANAVAPMNDHADANSNAYLLWKAIKAHFAPVTAVSGASLVNQLNSLWWNPKDTPNKLFAKFNHIVDQLSSIGEPPTELQQVRALLHALPNTDQASIIRLQLQQRGANCKIADVFAMMDDMHNLWREQNLNKSKSKEDTALAAKAQSKNDKNAGKGKAKKGKNDKQSNNDKKNNKKNDKDKSKSEANDSDEIIHKYMLRVIPNSALEALDAQSTEHALISTDTSIFDFALDSGCTRHVVCHRMLLYEPRVAKHTIVGIGNTRAAVKTCGKVLIAKNVELKNVMLVPGGNMNLVSVSRLIESKCIINSSLSMPQSVQ